MRDAWRGLHVDAVVARCIERVSEQQPLSRVGVFEAVDRLRSQEEAAGSGDARPVDDRERSTRQR
jgi:hypothetical protein